jgi:hypothetical protein
MFVNIGQWSVQVSNVFIVPTVLLYVDMEDPAMFHINT